MTPYRTLIESACRSLKLSAAETLIVHKFAPKHHARGYVKAVRCYRAIVRSA